MPRRLCKSNISRYNGIVDLRFKDLSYLVRDLPGKRYMSVIHCKKYPLKIEALVKTAPYAPQKFDDKAQALKGEVLALDQDEDGVRCDKCIKGKEPEGRWTVNKDIAEFLFSRVR